MATISKDMGIMEIVQQWPETVQILAGAGMGCLGCAAAHFESLEEGAVAHGIDVDALVEELNKAVQ